MKENRKYWNKNYIVNVWTIIYCVILFLIFPLYFQNSYINILEAKTGFFVISSVIYLVGCIIIMLPPIFLKKGENEKKAEERKKKYLLSPVDFFCAVLLFSIAVSVIMDDNRSEIIWGINGRYFGAAVLVLCVGIYYCFSRWFCWNTLFWWSCLVGAGIVSILAALNRFNIDILKMYEVIDPAQTQEYLSTIGQINILSGFLCIFLPLFTGLFLYSEKRFSKIFYGLGNILVYIAGICSNSDSFFLAVGIVTLFYFTIVLSDKKRLSDFLLLMSIEAICMFLLKIISAQVEVSVWREIQECWIKQMPWSIVAILFLFLFLFLKKKEDTRINFLRKLKKFWIVSLIILCIAIIAYVVLINVVPAGRNSAFVEKWLIFGDEWGTNRGYVWIRTLKLFYELPLKSQIFGVGLGEFSGFFEEYFIDSISRFGYYFEDAHNEFLQFLVTNGIIGLIGYAGMIISSIVLCIREKNEMKKIFTAFFLVWIAQAMVNNPTVFTTPYLFAMMGISQIPWGDALTAKSCSTNVKGGFGDYGRRDIRISGENDSE